MPTLGWKEAAFVDVEGSVRFRDDLVAIRAEHIALWKEDPDGRFKLELTSADCVTAEPVKFYPSL